LTHSIKCGILMSSDRQIQNEKLKPVPVLGAQVCWFIFAGLPMERAIFLGNIMAKLTHHETWAPISRGLVHHLQYMSSNAAKLFLYILLRVKSTGESKGAFRGFVIDCCEDLGWIKKTWYATLKELEPYIEVEKQNSRHKPFTIKVARYKGIGDFYRIPTGHSKQNSNGTVTGQYGDSNGTVTAAGTNKINDLQTLKKKKRRKEEKSNTKQEGCTWKNDFETYKAEAQAAMEKLLTDSSWLSERKGFHPNIDIEKTIKKAWLDFWLTQAGWKNKKQKRSESIDWVRTANSALTLNVNQVWLPRGQITKSPTDRML